MLASAAARLIASPATATAMTRSTGTVIARGHVQGIVSDIASIAEARAFASRAGDQSRLPAIARHIQLPSPASSPPPAPAFPLTTRAALARLLITRAPLWILDEPLNALDAAGIELVHTIIAEHLDGGGTVVLTSHLPVTVPDHVLREVVLG